MNHFNHFKRNIFHQQIFFFFYLYWIICVNANSNFLFPWTKPTHLLHQRCYCVLYVQSNRLKRIMDPSQTSFSILCVAKIIERNFFFFCFLQSIEWELIGKKYVKDIKWSLKIVWMRNAEVCRKIFQKVQKVTITNQFQFKNPINSHVYWSISSTFIK